MLCVFGKGRLGMDPEKKMNNASGSYYKVRIAVNRMVKKSVGESERETLWCSGLVHEGKLTYQMDAMKKGALVTFMANKGWVNCWTAKDGSQHADLDLGFLALIEAESNETNKTQQPTAPQTAHGMLQQEQAATTPNTQALAQNTFPVATPTAPQPTWDGEKWVLPQAAPVAQKDNALPF